MKACLEGIIEVLERQYEKYFECEITDTAPQHLVCRAVPSLHINHMQMSIIEVFICRRLHMNTSMILICIWLICRLGTTLHTKCCGAVRATKKRDRVSMQGPIILMRQKLWECLVKPRKKSPNVTLWYNFLQNEGTDKQDFKVL